MNPSSSVFSVRLPAAQLAAVAELARLTKRSRNAVIGLAVERYVAEELGFIEECRRATDEALAPEAPRVPHDAVRAWLDTWGTPAEDEAAAALEALEAELDAAPRSVTDP